MTYNVWKIEADGIYVGRILKGARGQIKPTKRMHISWLSLQKKNGEGATIPPINFQKKVQNSVTLRGGGLYRDKSTAFSRADPGPILATNERTD